MACEISSRVDGTCVSIYQGSDFINLTKLRALMLQKERVKNAEIESKKNLHLGDGAGIHGKT